MPLFYFYVSLRASKSERGNLEIVEPVPSKANGSHPRNDMGLPNKLAIVTI